MAPVASAGSFFSTSATRSVEDAPLCEQHPKCLPCHIFQTRRARPQVSSNRSGRHRLPSTPCQFLLRLRAEHSAQVPLVVKKLLGMSCGSCRCRRPCIAVFLGAHRGRESLPRCQSVTRTDPKKNNCRKMLTNVAGATGDQDTLLRRVNGRMITGREAAL